MKKIGIVGGIAWRSTAAYYAELCRRGEALAHDPHASPAMPEIVIESLDISKAVAWLGTDNDEASWSRFDQYHREALLRLKIAGADFALLASNTPHHRFRQITHGVGIPVINLFEAVADACSCLGASQVLVLGTEWTMRSTVLRATFRSRGVEAHGLRTEGLRRTLAGLIDELQQGESRGAAERLGEIVDASLTPSAGISRPVVCLACTELPLAFAANRARTVFEVDGITFVNTLAVHVDSTWQCAIGTGCL